jgi:ubiquinone/menaquinone biosynthesis C-methylase UbiE
MENHVCPWYIGYLLASPLRRLFLNPEKILSPYVKEGMTVLEVGPGMGFFSLPLAKLVGEPGHIICVDIQEKMLNNLRNRVDNAGLLWRIETRLCTDASLQIDDLKEKIDFVLAFAVVHEVLDTKKLFTEIFNSLKSGGVLLVSEPAGHVTKEEFDITLSIAQSVGFQILDSLKINRNHSVIMKRVS